MNSTPPMAMLNASVVLMAVPPTTAATRSGRATSTSWPVLSTPRAARMRPYSRATVVFPVPGEPANTRCLLIGGDGRPAAARRSDIWMSRTSVSTSRFTLSSPTRDDNSSSSADTSSLSQLPREPGFAEPASSFGRAGRRDGPASWRTLSSTSTSPSVSTTIPSCTLSRTRQATMNPLDCSRQSTPVWHSRTSPPSISMRA